MRLAWALGAAGAIACSYGLERSATACGGCFHPPAETPTVVTDHRMILSITKDQSTLYDQIKYSGAPSAFAWVLPISGTVDVGLSADVVFQTLDSLTTTTVNRLFATCPAPTNCNLTPISTTTATPGVGDVSVTKREVVGPYETVQLEATDAMALQTWLATNGFAVPADVKPVVDRYVAEKFGFLALKLLPGKGIQDMLPVRVTTHGPSAVLPLRMVAAGTGARVGIQLWVLGEGRYQPQNFPTFVVSDDDISWDWAQNRSNYVEVRAQKTAASNGRGWEIESSTSQSRALVENAIRSAPNDYLPVKDAQGVYVKTSAQVRDEDLTTLFTGLTNVGMRITRLRSDISKAALDADLVIAAPPDQAVIQTSRTPKHEIGQPQCPIYDGCNVIGTVPRDEALARQDGKSEETFSCAASPAKALPLATVGAGLAYLGLAIARARRRRRSE